MLRDEVVSLLPARVSYLCLQPTRQGQASYAHVHEIIAGLQRRGHEVTLHEPRAVAGRRGVVARLLMALVVQLGLWPRLSTTDVLYVRFHPAALPSVLLARVLSTRVIVEVNGTTADFVSVHRVLTPLAGLLRWLGRASLRAADAAVAVTDELAEWIRAQAPGLAVVVIPNAANPELFQPLAGSEESEQPYVCFVGALSPWQGVETLLEAVEFDEWPEDVRVCIAGDGSCRSLVQAAARSSDRVSYEGVIAYDQVGGLVARALAAVSLKTAAAWHASPLKVFEAMAAGVPLVVTDQPGQARIVEQAGCGIIVPTGDAAALARAVRRLREDAELRRNLGRAGHAAASTEHTWDRRAEATHRLITRVVAPVDSGDRA